MRKAKIHIIIVCILLMFSIAGFLIFHKVAPDKDLPVYIDRGTAAASTVSIVSPGAITVDNNTYIPPTTEYDDNNTRKEEDQMSYNEPSKTQWTPATKMDLEPKSITVFVNKEYYLPKNYVPENLLVPDIVFDSTSYSERMLMRKDAAEAIEKLFAAALEDGFSLYGISGYRSYDRQKEIFLNNIVHRGKKHTLKYSAAPGTSEHQTGLAMDVSSKSVRYKLITSFSDCDEGIWLANHAHEFGFIIRYPKDQFDSTGYAYEPWHIRYVGEDLADYLYTNNMTLDEYYKYTPSEGFDYEKEYADLINYRPPVTPTPIPEEEPEEEDPLDDPMGEDMEDENTDDLLEDELEDEDSDDSDLDDKDVDDENLDDEDINDEEIIDEEINDEDINDEDINDEDIEDEDVNDNDIEDEVPEVVDLVDENSDDQPSIPTITPDN